MAVNAARPLSEHNAPLRERSVGRVDVAHLEIEDGFGARRGVLLQIEPCAAEVEEGHALETVEQRQAEHVAIPGRRGVDIAHAAGDLAQGAK